MAHFFSKTQKSIPLVWIFLFNFSIISCHAQINVLPFEGYDLKDSIPKDESLQAVIAPWLKLQSAQPVPIKGSLNYSQNLNQFRNNLINNLAASDEWDLHYEKSILVASRRIFSKGRWKTTKNDVISYYEDSSSHQLIMRIYPDEIPLYMQDMTKITIDSTSNLEAIELVRKPDENNTKYYESEMFGVYNGINFYIKEVSPIESSIVAKNTLAYILNTINLYTAESILNVSEAELEPAYYSELTVYHGEQPGMYEVFSSVNPEKEGVLYLKIIDPDTNSDIAGEYLKEESKEIVGWSSNERKFLYNRPITITSVSSVFSSNKEYELLLIFQPTDESREYILKRKRMKFMLWER